MVEYRSLLSYDIWIAHLCIDVTYICVFHTHFTSYLTEPNFPFTLFNILETIARVALMLFIGICVCVLLSYAHEHLAQFVVGAYNQTIHTH